MSKAEKGKASKTEVGTKANETKPTYAPSELRRGKEGQEEFVWSKWDALLYDFLTAIQEAGVDAGKTKGNFHEILQITLRCNGDLVTKTRANPRLAHRVLGSVPCGHRVCREFIREVCQKRK